MPGWKKAERKIEKKRVAPAIAVVRPALRRVIAAARAGAWPAASSSRKRETISSE